MIRRKFYKQAKMQSLEEEFKDSVVLIAREMGWTIEYVLGMPIMRFNEVSKTIAKFYRRQNETINAGSVQGKTFGGLG